MVTFLIRANKMTTYSPKKVLVICWYTGAKKHILEITYFVAGSVRSVIKISVVIFSVMALGLT